MPPLQRRVARPVGLSLALVLIVPAVPHLLQNHPLDLVNLTFHKAGHVLLILEGQTITVLGGNLIQLLVPAVCIGVFLWHRDRYAASIVALSLGLSFAGVSAHIRDALHVVWT